MYSTNKPKPYMFNVRKSDAKYPIPNDENAEQRVKDSLEMYAAFGEVVFAQYSGFNDCWYIINNKREYLKPVGYEEERL